MPERWGVSFTAGALAGLGRVLLGATRDERSFRLLTLALIFAAGGVTAMLLRPPSDLARELRLCRAAARLSAGEGAGRSVWTLAAIDERALTPGQAIRLLYPGYDERLPPALRFRPPPAPRNIDAIRAAELRSLRRITLARHTADGAGATFTCSFIRLDGRTQWLDPADRSQLLLAAAFPDPQAGRGTCCIARDERVR
ncbi:MAG: hypothetical protein KatS3mg119_1474 [Rhodothalassiaceae bacterium]|nr:MAG: hypothetical protein KatS3mg119_1474 [Rhodothalassiaceae bacterium]